MINLKELDSDLASAGCDQPLRIAFSVLAKHVNAALAHAGTDLGQEELREYRRLRRIGEHA